MCNENNKLVKVTATLLYDEGEIISFWLFKETIDDNEVEYFDSLESMFCAWIKHHFDGVLTSVEVWDINVEQII